MQRSLTKTLEKHLRGHKRATALDKRYGGKLPDDLPITRQLIRGALKSRTK